MLRNKFNIYFIRKLSSISNTKLQNNLRNNVWESVIGLEIHAQIIADSKLFSGAGTAFGAPINQQVAFFDAALPGTLPVINQRCVVAGVKTALALNCNINLKSLFDRKHYFYADLPAGFQITQQRLPIAQGGYVNYMVRIPGKGTNFEPRVAHLIQLQLEQDSGKSLHDGNNQSLIDLNRAGVGLMEIVTEPDFRDGEEAAAFVKELRTILLKLNTCNCKMDEGAMRVDASISIRQPGEPLGTRTEVKNINSVRFIAKAIEYEINRQINLVESGGEVVNETRSFNFETGETISLRDKEKLHDYRFLPEPNLPPLRLYTNDTLPQNLDSSQVVNIDTIRDQLPELPEQQRTRLVEQYGLTLEKACVMVNEPGMVEYFEDVLRDEPDRSVKIVVNIIINELMSLLNDENKTYCECPVSTEKLGELVGLLQQRAISHSVMTKVLEILYNQQGISAKKVVEDNDWFQITDVEKITEFCVTVIANNPKQVKQYRKGKTKVLNSLVKQVMDISNEKADPKLASETMQRLLKES